MSNPDLSILIPARNEMFLARTIQDLLTNIRGNTEIIVVLDGAPADPPLPMDERVTVVWLHESVGQRIATNIACRLSKAKYVAKVDAHCAFDEGFDVKMIEKMKLAGDDVTMVPVMRNLHAFDWVCPDGHRRYQSPSGPCTTCGKPTERDVVWFAKPSPRSTGYCFNTEPKFQYFGELKKRLTPVDGLTETMSIQGSFFMLTQERYWALNICDKAFGSWGSQGIEVALKTWLSGGRVLVNHDTWYAHLFRTQGSDFGFPWPFDVVAAGKAKEMARSIFFTGTFPKQIRPLPWLLEKFWPVPGWTLDDVAKLKANVMPELRAEPEKPSEPEDEGEGVSEHGIPLPGKVAPPQKGIIYYTDNRLDPVIAYRTRLQLLKAKLPIVSASLKPIDFGENIVLPLERGPLTMAKQILAALEASTAEYVFFCEHDVLYHPSHFDFTPPSKQVYYYNVNVWKVNSATGHCVKVDDCRQLSGLCGYRKTLIRHYRERIRRIEAEGFTRKMGFEPGTHRRQERVDDLKSATWSSELPNVDIRHTQNLTSSRWRPEEFRDQRYVRGWKEADEVPGWGRIVL